MTIVFKENPVLISLLKISPSLVLFFIFTVAACKSQHSIMAESIILSVEQEKTVQGLSISYLSYSHEHSSSGPDEPFEATMGVYFLQLVTGNQSEEVTLYHGVNSEETVLDWEGYKITLFLVEEGQKTIHLRIGKSN